MEKKLIKFIKSYKYLCEMGKLANDVSMKRLNLAWK